MVASQNPSQELHKFLGKLMNSLMGHASLSGPNPDPPCVQIWKGLNNPFN